MAEEVELEFRATGPLPEVLAGMHADVVRLGDEHKRVHAEIQTDLVKSGESAQKFNDDLKATSQIIVAVAKSGAQGLPALAKNLQGVLDLTQEVKGSLSDTDKANLTNVNNALRDMAQKAGIVVKEVQGERKARIDNLVEVKKLTAEEAKLLLQVQGVVDSLREAGAVPQPDPTPTIEGMKSLQLQIREASAEAIRLRRESGPTSEAYKQAAEKVAVLKKELKDAQQDVRALNPGSQVGAFARLGSALASGGQAAGSFFAAFGAGNDKLQETIFRFQTFIFGLQGAQSFLLDFTDSYEQLKLVLGITTKEQVINTAASEADAVVKGEQAVATAAVGTASSGSVAGIKAFGAALVSTPLGLVLLALASVVGLLVAFSGQTEKATFKYQKFLDLVNRKIQRTDLNLDVKQAELLNQLAAERLQRQKDFEAGRRTSAEQTRTEIERDAARQAELDAAATSNTQQAIDARKQLFQELKDLKRDALKTDDNQRATDILNDKKFSELRMALDLDENATKEEVADAYYAKKAEFRAADLQGQTDVLRKEAARFDAQTRLLAEQQEKEKAAAELRLRIREELSANILALEKNLADQIAALQLEQADPNKQLELQRQADAKAIDELERNLRRELALKTQSAEKLSELSDQQKKDLADRLIDEQGLGQLTLDKQEQFNTLRLLSEQKFLRASLALRDEQESAAFELVADKQQQALANLDKNLAEREKMLRQQGFTDAQIAEDAAKQVALVQNQFATERLDLEEQTQLDLIGARTAAGKGNAAAERAAQIEILNVKIEFAEKALALIEDDGSAESKARIAAAQKEIADLRAGLKQETDKVVPVDIFDLLGFEFSDEEKAKLNEALASIKDSLQSIANSYFESQRAILDNQAATNDEYLQNLQNQIGDVQSELDAAIEDEKAGYANSANAKRKQLADLKKAEQDALAEQKRIQKEKQDLARQQVVVDAITQASALATSVANVFLAESKEGVAGVVAAIAAGLSIFAQFIAIKAKLQQASAPQAFREGTEYVDRPGLYPQGIDTVPAMLTRGEAVVPVAENEKYKQVVRAIVNDDPASLDLIDLKPLLEGTGIFLMDEEAERIVELHNTTNNTAVNLSTARLEERVEEVATEVREWRSESRVKKSTEWLSDGTRIERVTNGNTTTEYRFRPGQ